MTTNFEIRYAAHYNDVKHYDTEKLREHFLVTNLFSKDSINMVYSHYDRIIVGGIYPVNEPVILKTIDPLRSENFLDRREIGIYNIGGKGKIHVDGEMYELDFKESLYIGKGKKEIIFESFNDHNPAKFYFNSSPAHLNFPTRKITKSQAQIAELGSNQTANHRFVNKMLVNQVLPTCQLQMGMTELTSGNVWNTMPPHIHDRRMEVYFYFEIPEDQQICHFMGQPHETRHIWMANEQAVISPDWSIHSACATHNYTFIWGMAGENIDYGDMDAVEPKNLL